MIFMRSSHVLSYPVHPCGIAFLQGYVSDKCPECKDGDLDFAMAGDGRWDIKWKFVPCPGSNDKPSFLFEGA